MFVVNLSGFIISERDRSPHYRAADQLLVVEMEVLRGMLSVSKPQAMSVRASSRPVNPRSRGKLSRDATGNASRNSVFRSMISGFMRSVLRSVKVSVNSDFTDDNSSRNPSSL